MVTPRMPGHWWAVHHYDAVGAMQYFFVVSGFVNMKSAETELDRFDLKAGCLFIQKRMARLLPMYWFAMLSLTLTYLCLNKQGLLCRAGFYFQESMAVQSLRPGILPANAGNTPDWFVSALLALNVCFPVLYNLCPSRSSSISALIILLLVVRSSHFFVPGLGDMYGMSSTNPITRIPEFIVGMLSAIWCRQMSPQAKAWPCWGFVFDASVVLVYTIFELRSHHGMPPTGDLGITGLFCIMVISANAAVEAPLHGAPTTFRFWPKVGFTGMLFSSFPIQIVARYSWNFYLLQEVVTQFCIAYLPMDLFTHFAFLPLLFLVGVLADVAVDQPVHRALVRYLRYQQSQ